MTRSICGMRLAYRSSCLRASRDGQPTLSTSQSEMTALRYDWVMSHCRSSTSGTVRTFRSLTPGNNVGPCAGAHFPSAPHSGRPLGSGGFPEVLHASGACATLGHDRCARSAASCSRWISTESSYLRTRSPGAVSSGAQPLSSWWTWAPLFHATATFSRQVVTLVSPMAVRHLTHVARQLHPAVAISSSIQVANARFSDRRGEAVSAKNRPYMREGRGTAL